MFFRLLLLQEKEQLLRELRSIDPKGRSSEEITSIRQRIAQLEYDLKHALQISNKQIQERSVILKFYCQMIGNHSPFVVYTPSCNPSMPICGSPNVIC